MMSSEILDSQSEMVLNNESEECCFAPKQIDITVHSNQYPYPHQNVAHSEILKDLKLHENLFDPKPQKQVDSSQVSQRHIFFKRNYDKTNKNTPRFVVKLLVTYLRNYQEFYPPEIFEIVRNECQKLQEWHKSKRQNVYSIRHLSLFFSDDNLFTQKGTKINRLVFRKILMEYSLNEMNEPRSQIKQNRIDYYKACKIFSLRCMSKGLINRNQTK